MNLTTNLVVLTLSMTLAACNANQKSQNTTLQTSNTGTKSTKVTDPIPQAGGYSNIGNAKLQQLVEKGVVLVDIRRPEEWRQTGIVKGSKTITFFDHTGSINPNFVPEFTAIAKPDKPVMLICRTGNRTQAASQAIAQQLGYKDVMNVTHGITGWIAEQRPVNVY